jgi:hypothetical protein
VYLLQVNETIANFANIERTMSPRMRWQWRLQQLMYRANYDKLLQVRLVAEREGEVTALRILRAGLPRRSTAWLSTHQGVISSTAIAALMANATAALSKAAALSETASLPYWIEMRVWAEAVFQSTHQQFSVPIYGGEYTRRGSNLDLAKMPLSNAPYLLQSFVEIRKKSSPEEQAQMLTQLAYWDDAGDGGFYDDLGEVGNSPRFVHAVHVPDWGDQTGDQAIVQYPIAAIKTPSEQYYQSSGSIKGLNKQFQHNKTDHPPPMLTNATRRSQLNLVKTAPILPSGYGRENRGAIGGPHPLTAQAPIELRYTGLPAGAVYNVSVTGPSKLAGFDLSANGHIIWSPSDEPTRQVEAGRAGVSMDDKKVLHWSIPASLTQKGGELLLAWGSSCCEVELNEVWLRRVG